jgi:hypothetical protein
MQHLYTFFDFVNEGKTEDIHAKHYSGIVIDTFHQIITADPTTITQNGETKKLGTYSKWLLKLYQDGKLLLEDLYKATEYLTMFDKLKAQKVVTGAEADINRYGSLPDLFKYIKTIGGTGETSEDESYLLNDRYYINQGEAEVFHEDDDYLIVIPRTLKASQFYAHGTEWCTKYPDNFKEYSEQGDLYVIIVKRKLNTDDDNRMMQFHFQSSQFMDMNDERLPLQVRVAFLTFFQRVKDSWRLYYDQVGTFHEGKANVQQNGKWGVVDLEGNEVVSLRYDYIDDFSEGRARVKRDERYGFIDLDGNEVVSLKYGYCGDYHESRAVIKRNGKWGVVDLEGKVVVPPKYNSIGYYQEGRASVMLNWKYGFVDLDGKEVVPPHYDDVWGFSEGRAMVELKGKCGFIDLGGTEVVPMRYDWACDYQEGRAKVKRNGKYGFIDLVGNEVAPLKYDYADIFYQGRASVELNGKHGYIDLDGNETWD